MPSKEFNIKIDEMKETLLKRNLSQEKDFTHELYKEIEDSLKNEIKTLGDKNMTMNNNTCTKLLEDIFDQFEKSIILENRTKYLGGFAYKFAMDNVVTKLEWKRTIGIDEKEWKIITSFPFNL